MNEPSQQRKLISRALPIFVLSLASVCAHAQIPDPKASPKPMMMRMHHQQGVEMAEMQVKQGKSAEMKTMAKNIVAAQKKEIAQFDKWLAKHK